MCKGRDAATFGGNGSYPPSDPIWSNSLEYLIDHPILVDYPYGFGSGGHAEMAGASGFVVLMPPLNVNWSDPSENLTVVVPHNVSIVQIRAWGGGGGGALVSGGAGGFASGTFGVQTGDQIILSVGGGGQTASGNQGAEGGIHGGARGGSSHLGGGGGGGGCTRVFRIPADGGTPILLLVAGGGGGAGGGQFGGLGGAAGGRDAHGGTNGSSPDSGSGGSGGNQGQILVSGGFAGVTGQPLFLFFFLNYYSANI